KNIVYSHCNAIEIDFDGNLLLSTKRFDEITKINKNTGDIMWRLGGENNQFLFINDSAKFCFQHDIRRLPNGNITMYDNAEYTGNPPRGLEYKIDTFQMTAQLVRELTHPLVLDAPSMGNLQRLENGNSFISWGTVDPGTPN
ncbi:MAG: aryl-sulfate sulfotransferase, partial [Bacteroidetes bacterium]|nr:aryl-sulfate sulfotransferase [Bacteroidota bacterium]